MIGTNNLRAERGVDLKRDEDPFNIFENKDVAEIIFFNALTTVAGLLHLKLVSRRWNQMVCDIYTDPKISGLLARSLQPFHQFAFPDGNLYKAINAGSLIYNISLALEDYFDTSDLNAIASENYFDTSLDAIINTCHTRFSSESSQNGPINARKIRQIFQDQSKDVIKILRLLEQDLHHYHREKIKRLFGDNASGQSLNKDKEYMWKKEYALKHGLTLFRMQAREQKDAKTKEVISLRLKQIFGFLKKIGIVVS